MSYHDGKMVDYIPTDEDLKSGFDTILDIPQNKNA